MRQALRHHWLNTIVSVLDSAFHLTDHEQLATIDIVNKLLTRLNIPERGVPTSLPAPVALEVESGLYTIQLTHTRDSGLVRPVRAVHQGQDMVVSAEAWRDALTGMITSAYELTPPEKLFLASVVTDLLAALGVPNRAAAFFPDAVVRAYRNSPEGLASVQNPVNPPVQPPRPRR